MKLGYARVSTSEQNTHRQEDLLSQQGCERIFIDIGSGKKGTPRPELEKLKNILRKGDQIVITQLSRLGRSTKELIELSGWLREMEVDLVSLKENIDTQTPSGKFMFTILAAMAEFERDLIVMRTKEGLAAARARGRKGGRPKGISNKAKEQAHMALYYHTKRKDLSIKEIMKLTGISNKTTLYKRIEWAKSNPIKKKGLDD